MPVIRVLEEVRAAIERELATGAPSLPTVARDLGTSERTLQRRLADERLSFRELVESVREQLARSYLAELRLPIADVAFRLGYAETSAFLRAFKRWTGTTPTRWREMPPYGPHVAVPRQSGSSQSTRKSQSSSIASPHDVSCALQPAGGNDARSSMLTSPPK